MELSTTATPIGMRQRSSGVTVVTRAETREAGGELVVEQFMVTFVRGAQGAEDVGDEAPAHGFDESLREREPDAEVAQTFDSDQTYRYAEAAGDPMQIHLDDEFAKSVGLPGIIIHGLCTMAFTSRAADRARLPRRPDAAAAARGPLRQHRAARADDHDADLGRGRGRRARHPRLRDELRCRRGGDQGRARRDCEAESARTKLDRPPLRPLL